MTLLIAYLRQRRAALLPPAFLLIFCAIFALYGLPLYAVAYAALLCAVVYAAAFAVGFARFCSRHARLAQLQSCIDVCAEHLPMPDGLLECDYQSLLRALAGARDALLHAAQARYAERIGYYTLWAHQIKTPIAALRLQLSGDDTAEGRAMRVELTRIEQYVEMALCYLRLDGAQTDYVFALCALAPLPRGCAKKLAPQFIHKRIRLELAETDDSALTDEKWLAFVVEQLLQNAVKYTPPGGRVRLHVTPGPVLHVEDNGIGIAPQDLPRIFESGFTGQNGRQDKRASGIGLSLCRRICDALGHEIACTSTVGRGTHITLDLRRAPLEAD